MFRYHFGVSPPVLPGVVPPLNLTAAYRSLWYARFGQGSSISLPKVMALHRRGSISHTGWSFDWNNPSMNYLYHRTFSRPVPYIRNIGKKLKSEKISTIAERVWYNQFSGYKYRQKEGCFNTGTIKRFTSESRTKTGRTGKTDWQSSMVWLFIIYFAEQITWSKSTHY